MKNKHLKALEKLRHKLEKKQAKAQKEQERSQKKGYKKFVRKHQGICPRCQHPAYQHRFLQHQMVNIGAMLFGGQQPDAQNMNPPPGHAHGQCIEKVEETVEGMVRLVPCKCDLDPKEAQLNSDKRKSMSTFDSLMGSIRVQQTPQ